MAKIDELSMSLLAGYGHEPTARLDNKDGRIVGVVSVKPVGIPRASPRPLNQRQLPLVLNRIMAAFNKAQGEKP